MAPSNVGDLATDTAKWEIEDCLEPISKFRICVKEHNIHTCSV